MPVLHAHLLTLLQEGLKAHEGGQQQHSNPFDMFSNFFGGRERKHLQSIRWTPSLTLDSDPAQDNVRRGPTSVTEFEVTLADM